MKKILLKDLLREIFKSFPRFISITILIAIGATFFLGLKSAAPNMLATADDYLKRHTFFDMRIQTTDCFNEEDRNEIEDLSDISYAELKHVIQVITKEKELVIEIESYGEKQFEIVEGNPPTKKNEILIDKKAKKDFKIGDKLSFLNNSGEQTELLLEEEFVIVGFANYYRYLGQNDRGLSGIGSGELAIFGTILDEAFQMDDFNCLDVHMRKKWREHQVYSDKYLKKLDSISKQVVTLREEQQNERKKELHTKIEDEKREIEQSKKSLAHSRNELDIQIAELEKSLLVQGSNPFFAKNNDLLATLVDQKEELEIQESDLDELLKELTNQEKDIELIDYKLTKIDETVSFISFKENIQRLDALGNIIPLIFYFVANLVTVTIITRMIDQDRKHIGTLKALGVNNQLIILKYRFYTLISGIMGLGIGMLAGIFPFSQLLISLYSPMYILGDYQTLIYWDFLLIVIFISFICIVIIPFFVYRNLLSSSALYLMRGKTPKSGQKIFLENIDFIWNRLTFNIKMNFRNIVRYKFRMILLFIGILGCTSLLIIGFGARNSVSRLIDFQFEKVLQYKMQVLFKNQIPKAELVEYESFISERKEIKSIATIQETGHIRLENTDLEIVLVSPSSDNDRRLEEFIEFTDSVTKKSLKMTQNQVFVTKKLAKILNISKNDKVKIELNGVNRDYQVTNIVDNYFMNYLYVSADVYQEGGKYKQGNRVDLLNFQQLDKIDQESLLNLSAVSGINRVSQSKFRALEVTNQLNKLIVVVILASAILGFVVVYNLSYINVLERLPEIAVLYVMGYRYKELTVYVFREIFFLGIFAIISGCFFGFWGHDIVMEQIELDNFCFPELLKWEVSLYTILILLLITFLLFILMHKKIKDINVVSSLKDRE